MKKKIILRAVVLLAVTLFGLLIWVRGYSYEIRNATYEEACKAGVVKVFNPPGARNITAWIRPARMGITAVFEIEEADFVLWSKSKSWELKEIVDMNISNISAVADPNGSETISDGLMYKVDNSSSDNPNGLFRLYVYDRVKGVGYFTQF